MKNLKNLFIASALTLSSASVFANTFTDYLAALEAEAKFDVSYLPSYQAQPDFTTTAGKLEAKVAEVQGFWATHTETTATAATTSTDAGTDTASYLASLAASASQVSTMRTLSADEAAALAAAEDEIVALLASVTK